MLAQGAYATWCQSGVVNARLVVTSRRLDVNKERLKRRARRLTRRARTELRTAFRFLQSERFARALIACVDLAVTVYQLVASMVT